MFGFSRFFILFSILSIVIFALFPQIDLGVSELFYRVNDGFFLKHQEPFDFLYHEVKWFVIVPVVALLVLLVYQLISAKRLPTLNPKAIAFLLTFLIIGPGLVTNSILKENSTRSRPVQIHHFDPQSHKHFTPYYSLKGECKSNCSFVSGHLAAAAFYLAFAYLFHSRLLFALSLGFVVLMGVTRVVQGAHFLSDVIFSFIINLIILKLIYYLFFKEEARLEK